jgi:hypothetical protein
MQAARWMRTFAALGILFLAGTLARSCYLDQQVERLPCSDPAIAGDASKDNAGNDNANKDNAGKAGTPAPSMVNFAPKRIELGSQVCVAITGAQSVATDKDGKPALHLFIDGLELKGSAGRFADSGKTLVLFDVARTADDSEAWATIIGHLGRGSGGAALGSVRARIGAGTDSGEFAGATLPPIELTIVDPLTFALGIAALVAAVVALCLAARTSAILRDGDAESTFSLARVQMAFWLYLITATFLYVWLVTGDYNGVLTSQALTLLGISGTTGLMAIAVNPSTVPTASQGFWTDILSDGGGIALHRLQVVVWTAILGAVFLAEIYNSFRLPTFDSNLLILMGISGVTYVGFKFNEK